jgi:pentatricopeptide repeat protein
MKEIDIKEKIVTIVDQRGIILDADKAVPLITLYGMSGERKKADGLLQRMKDAGTQRNSAVYNSMIKCHAGDLQKIDSLFKEMIDTKGIKLNRYIYSSMINAYSKNIEKATEFFDQMIENGTKPDLVSFRMILQALLKNGDIKKAEEFFFRYQDASRPPDGFKNWYEWFKIEMK